MTGSRKRSADRQLYLNVKPRTIKLLEENNRKLIKYLRNKCNKGKIYLHDGIIYCFSDKYMYVNTELNVSSQIDLKNIILSKNKLINRSNNDSTYCMLP